MEELIKAMLRDDAQRKPRNGPTVYVKVSRKVAGAYTVVYSALMFTPDTGIRFDRKAV